MPYDPGYNPDNLPRHELDLEHFMKVARAQIGDRYQFGAEVDGDPDPDAFDSSELVQWAAQEAGVRDMPDGSWNQYRWLHDRGASVDLDQALHTKGALVFGFSSDPLASADRPTRAYVGISLGDGRNVLDVSERSGEVREMPHGGFYGYGAVIPDFHPLDEPPVTDLWEDRNDDGVPDVWQNADPGGPPGHGVDPVMPGDPVFGPRPGRPVLVPDDRTTEPGPGRIVYETADDPVNPVSPAAQPEPGVSYGPDGRTIHQQLPGDERYADDIQPANGPVPSPDDTGPGVSYPDEPLPDDQVCYPDEDEGLTSQAEPVPVPGRDPVAYADSSDFDADSGGDPGYGATYPDAYADSYTDLPADA